MADLLRRDDGFPKVCDAVFATVVPDDRGRVAVLHWARCQHFGVPLTLLDFEVVQLLPKCWVELQERQEHFVRLCAARWPHGSAAYVEGVVLAQQAEQRGVHAELVPEALTTPEAWPALGMAATFHLRAGSVKRASAVDARARSVPFGPLTYQGQERGEDPTVPAFLYGIVMALEQHEAWMRPAVAERLA